MSAWSIVKRTVLSAPNGAAGTAQLQAGMLATGGRSYQVHAVHESGARVPPGPNPFTTKAARDREAERLAKIVA